MKVNPPLEPTIRLVIGNFVSDSGSALRYTDGE
jgi:hypothetical protein